MAEILGQTQTNTDFTELQSLQFIIEQMIRNINTVLPCKITKADNTKFIYSVLPLINYLGSNNKPITPPIIYNVVASHVFGANAGIITEFAVDDIVLVAFCQRDITIFKNTKGQQSNPPTSRIYDLADGIILFAIKFNQINDNYIKILQNEINIKKGNTEITLNGTTAVVKNGINTITINNDNIVINTSTVTINASESVTVTTPDFIINGNLEVTGALATPPIAYASHTHTSGAVGDPTSPPLP